VRALLTGQCSRFIDEDDGPASRPMHPLANGRSGCGTYCGWVQELGDNILEETGEGRTAQLEASGHREDLSPDAVLEELDQHYPVRTKPLARRTLRVRGSSALAGR